MTTFDPIIIVPLLALLGVASCIDLRERRIPNTLSIGGVAIGLTMSSAVWGPSGLLLGICGLLLCLVCLLPFYLTGGMGAGDVKLMAAVGAFLGPLHGFLAVSLTLCAGAVLGLVFVAWRTLAQAAERHHVFGWHGGRLGAAQIENDLKSKIPYAGAIALGTTIEIWQAPALLSLLPKGVL